MKTKDYILTNVTELFNRQGFTGTSLREAAAYLEMSDGNLRYHFTNKEELVLAIFQQMLQDMEGVLRGEEIDWETNLFLKVREQFQLIFYIMYQYRFIFIESPLLLNKYKGFSASFKKLYEARRTFFINFFEEGKNRGILNSEYKKEEYNMLFEQIFIISDNWIKYLDLGNAGTLDQKINHYIDLCMGLLQTAIPAKDQ